MTVAFFSGHLICLAQKSDPAVEPPAVGVTASSANPAVTARSRRATPAANAGMAGGGYTSGNPVFGSSKGDSIPPVMIRFSQPEVKSSVGLEEDLFVMARVISRTLERAEADKVVTKLGVPMLLTGSGRSVRPMYIEGTGPLFLIKVSFSLMPPPEIEKKAALTNSPESEWIEAHRDVFGATEAVFDEPSSRTSDYNDEQVALLKNELVGVLKNAANIRGLKSEEFVNIAVFGPASSVRISAPVKAGDAGGKYSVNAIGYVSISGAGKGTVLTLRAKKTDIDAVASGKLDANAFKAKVTVTTYFGSGASTSSINSWIQENTGRNRQ
jgi:hypothetical protein